MKNSFRIFLLYSLFIHVLVFSSFFRIIKLEEEFIRDISLDTAGADFDMERLLNYDFFESVLSPFLDSAVIESLWQEDSLDIKKWASLQPADQDVMGPGWYGTIYERSRALRDLLEKYRQSPQVDTLFAQSEFLRSAVLEQILKSLKEQGIQELPGELDWKKLLTDLTDLLKEYYDIKEGGSSGKSRDQVLLSQLLQNADLMKLWKEAMLFSLQDVALERLREAMRMAMKMCMSKCGLKPGSGGNKELDFPSSGKGGAFIGTSEIPAEDFEQCFLEALKRIGGGGLSQMASLFNRGKLYEQLAKEARAMALESLGGSSDARSWINEIDFAGTIKAALETGGKGSYDTKQVAEYLETIRKGLGEDIANWFGQGLTQEILRRNPYLYNEWAREYLDLVSKLASTPNLIMPNLNKYAEAVKNVRNRYLSGDTELALVTDIIARPEEKEYCIPQRVYMPERIKKPDMQPKYKPLIKSEAYSHAWGGAVRAAQPIVLDGHLNEWQHCKPYALCGSGQGLEKLPSELQSCNCLYVQWDNQGLYFAYQINDHRDNRYLTKVFWDTDALEIFLDPHNLKDSHRIKGRSFQFWVWPRAKTKKRCTGQSVFSTPRRFIPKILRDGLIRFASVRNGNQYTCEAFIPAVLLEKWYPLPGKIIGFNYSINNGEGVFIRWVTNMGENISHCPNLWGDLLLMGSDAVIELNPEDCILPGQNLEVTVIDHDMNLKVKTKDKIWIKARSKLTDDQLPLALTETGENSGVFSTELGTVFALKPKEKERISVRPGDILEIYYLDQQGSGGKKNVPVVREIQVGRGIFSFEHR